MPTFAVRTLGLLGILGGGILLVGLPPFDLAWTPDTFNVRLVLYGIGAMAVVVGIHHRQIRAAPALARSAAIPCVTAHAAYTVLIIRAVSQPGQIGPSDYGPGFDALAITMWLADSWFGVVTVRLGRAGRWGGLALALGSPLALMGIAQLGLVDGPLQAIVVPMALLGLALNGLGWVLLGFALTRQAKANRSSSPVHGLPSP